MHPLPNLLLGLLRVAAWLLWRPPMGIAKSRKPDPPRPPRKPCLTFAIYPVPDEIHSVIRTVWYKSGRVVEVDEIQLEECSDAINVFQYVVGGALRSGCDVTVLTTYSPEDLGVPTQ